MHFFPILSTLRRHKTAATLIILEIAFTCAIVCNTVFVIRERLARMDRPSGVAEAELLDVRLTGIGTKTDPYALTEQDLAALRAIPGVKGVAVANEVPFGNSSWNSDVSPRPQDPSGVNATMYIGSPGLLDVLGTQLAAGRGFLPGEYVDYEAAEKKVTSISSVILTRDLANKLFPGKNAVGRNVYVIGEYPQTVVGVVDRLARPNDFGHPDHAFYTMIMPIKLPYTQAGHYVVRLDPSRAAEIKAAIETTLTRIDPARIVLRELSFAEVRADYFKQDRSMAYLLVGVSLALLVITALGVVGLASFWVQQRTRQIGIRRALGATRGDILRYFQVENFILATAGIVLGMVLAYGINLWLMHSYQVPRLPAEFLPIGAALLWLLGQLAVLGPAMRAATIPPAIATRTV
ncbi:MAG: ABC transporter permease [Acidobacteriota bacterium]